MRVFLLFFFFFTSFLESKEMKYLLSICAIFKNETKFLEEWIEYHRLVGVEHFYLYDNNSIDAPKHKLKKYIKKGIVTLKRWPDYLGKLKKEKPFTWALSTQVTAYENALKLRNKETKWLIFLDVNEFLVPIGKNHLGKLLDQYDQYSAIQISSHYFDASFGKNFPVNKLIAETTTLVGTPSLNIETSVIKQIVKPKDCNMYTWPPYRCELKDHYKSLVLNETIICINRYINRKKIYLHSNKRKINLDNRLLTQTEQNEILKQGYEFEDCKKYIFKFLPKLKQKMEIK